MTVRRIAVEVDVKGKEQLRSTAQDLSKVQKASEAGVTGGKATKPDVQNVADLRTKFNLFKQMQTIITQMSKDMVGSKQHLMNLRLR